MINSEVRSGYILPVFACAGAVAAYQCLCQNSILDNQVSLDLIDPAEIVNIPIEQVAILQPNLALGITRSDPGDNIDLTRHTPIWTLVELISSEDETKPLITIIGGEGIGRDEKTGKSAIYRYADRLIRTNLERLLKPDHKIKITIILPQGRELATRTSNAAFGIVEGLALLGTTGISEPLSAPGTLAIFQEELTKKASLFDSLVFCIGENGLDFAAKLGMNPEQLIKTANWLGPLLVGAGFAGVKSILLFGYHGKLIKLAGGIFHTHHHLADGRLEILTAHAGKMGLPTAELQTILAMATTDDALKYLQKLDENLGSNWVELIYNSLALEIDKRSNAYIYTHSQKQVNVGVLMFDRQRKIIVKSQIADQIMQQFC